MCLWLFCVYGVELNTPFVSGFKFVLGETREGCHINYPGCNVLIISPTHPTLSTSQSEAQTPTHSCI